MKFSELMALSCFYMLGKSELLIKTLPDGASPADSVGLGVFWLVEPDDEVTYVAQWIEPKHHRLIERN